MQYIFPVISVVVSLLPALFIVALKWAYPPGERHTTDVPLEELRKRYKWHEGGQILLTFGLSVPMIYLSWLLFRGLGQLSAGQLPEARFAMVPDSLSWFIPAMLLGFVAAGLIVEVCWKHLLADRYAEFTAYTALKNGMDPARVSAVVLPAVGALLGLGTFLLLDNYVLVHEDRIVVNGFLSFKEEVFRIDDLEEIKLGYQIHNMKGGMTRRPDGVYVFRFADGRFWSSNYLPDSFPKKRYPELIDFLSQASGVPVTITPVIEHEEL